MPENPRDGFIQYAHQTKLHVFEYLDSLPPLLRDFHLFMGNTMGAREYWHDWYDVRGRLLEGFDSSKNQAVLVDIGGGKGHDVKSFYSAFMEASTEQERKLILQDLPHVIEAIPDNELPPAVVKMSHDFFKEQTVRGRTSLSFFWADMLTITQARAATSFITFFTTGLTITAIRSLGA